MLYLHTERNSVIHIFQEQKQINSQANLLIHVSAKTPNDSCLLSFFHYSVPFGRRNSLQPNQVPYNNACLLTCGLSNSLPTFTTMASHLRLGSFVKIAIGDHSKSYFFTNWSVRSTTLLALLSEFNRAFSKPIEL